MQGSELSIVLLNAIVVLVAYLSIYPKVAKADFNKVSLLDLLVSGFVLLVVGTSYYGTGAVFSLLGFELNWFWFTLITFGMCEIPMLLWYCKKHQMRLPHQKSD